MPEILYRKWRPNSFSELFGQEHVATTLTNALASGRIAHAYLFAGPRGTGKTTSGRLLGKALNCTNRQNGEPCNRCPSCVDYLGGRAMDLIEMDAASNRGIEEIRSLRDKVAFAPGAGEFKVYLIDEVHMLTDAAFNALLKTLEEPPPHVVFILATTEAHKVPATIASRCQRFDFRRAPLGSMVANLQRICAGEGIQAAEEALELIARTATGSHRDAVNLLDQLVTSYGNDLSAEHVRAGLGLIGDERSERLARLAITGDLGGGLELIASVRDDGLDLRQFQRELVAELRTLLMVKSGLSASQAGATEDRRRDIDAAIANVPVSRILTALRAFGEADLKLDPNSTLPLDIALAETALGEAVVASAAMAAGQSEAQAAPPRPAAAARTPAAASSAPQRPSSPPSAPPARAEPAPAPADPTSQEAPPSFLRAEPPAFPADPEAPGNGHVAAGDIAALRRSMRQIQDIARRSEFQVGALLNSVCDIIEADDTSVTFGFRFPRQVDMIQDPKKLKALSDAVSSVLGRDTSVRCVHEPNVTDWKTREPASRSSLVRAAQEMGARVISPEPEEDQ